MTFLREFWAFLKTRKRYWLVPILLILGLLAALILLTGGPAQTPFIYSLF